MKIAYIALKGMPLGGGIEKYTEEVGSRLAGRGHDIVVYAMRHYGASDCIYRGMRIRTLPTIRSRGLEKPVIALLASAIEAFDRDVDIVHMHAFGIAAFGILPRLMGRTVITQGHGIEWKRSKWGWLGRFVLRLNEWPSVKFPQAVTVVSKVQQEYLLSKYGVHSVHIPTGVNPPVILKPEIITEYGIKGGDYVLFAGRLVREKGTHHLIRAFRGLDTTCRLVIAGDAEYESGYKYELKKLSADDPRIIFTGFVTGQRLHELFSNSAVFVLPSEIEGLPTALLEAMSYGSCVLASNIPENIEALSGLGYTFKSGDPDDLASKLKELLSKPDMANRFGKMAQKHVLSNYGWDSIAERMEDFYKEIIDIS